MQIVWCVRVALGQNWMKCDKNTTREGKRGAAAKANEWEWEKQRMRDSLKLISMLIAVQVNRIVINSAIVVSQQSS